MNLFVYGTLLFPEIRELVGGRVFRSGAAVLEGFQVKLVRNATFPGIVRVSGGAIDSASGELLFDLTEREMEKFDQYEDPFYARTMVSVTLENGSVMEGFVYEVPEERADQILSDIPWSREWFETHHYKEFVGRWL